MIRILGISAYYHDSSAAIIADGAIVAAAQEERFTRVKGNSSFPHNAIAFCLETAGIGIDAVDYIVFYENPIVKFERLFLSHVVTAPHSFKSFNAAFSTWLTGKLWMESEIATELGTNKRIHFCDHHYAHAASAFYPSPFSRAAILTIDGVGEWSTTTWGVAKDESLELKKEIRFPNSLGLLYSAFTYYTGFKINSGEYKLMGLAPYGQPRFVDVIKSKLVFLNEDGSIVLNQKYFDYVGGLVMTNAAFDTLLGGKARAPESLITQREMDLAASIQQVLNEAVLKMARHVKEQTREDYLVLAGGVALNVVATGLLSASRIFEKIWIQPAAGDAGGALGAALWFWHSALGNSRKAQVPDGMHGAFLGTDIPPSSAADDEMLKRLGGIWHALPEQELHARVANAVSEGKVVAVARGRMEFGPRALGGRSILGDARSSSMQSHMNLKIKFRESFRPFAPIILEQHAAEYFETEQESPYMLLVYPVRQNRRLPVTEEDSKLFGIDLLNKPRSEIPAVTHVDFSARVQTVDKQRNPFMHGVLEQFRQKTGCPLMVNTSFNVRGEPIVNTVEDAYRCFMATEIDCLVAGNRFFLREEQRDRPLNDADREKWLRRFDLD